MPHPVLMRRNSGSPYETVPPGQFRTFDGVNDSLQSASTIDLSGVNKITIACWLWWNAFVNNDDFLWEFGSNWTSGAGRFVCDPNDTSVAFGVAHNGNVGQYRALYTRPPAAAWVHIAIVHDFSATTEIEAYFNGALQTPTSTPSSNNNTGSFGNQTLNVMSRDNNTLFGEGRLARLAIWPGVALAASEVGELYRGKLATTIQPGVNPYYWPIRGVSSPELSADNRGIALTVNG